MRRLIGRFLLTPHTSLSGKRLHSAPLPSKIGNSTIDKVLFIKGFPEASHCKGNERENVGEEFGDNWRSSVIDATLLGNVNPY